MISRRTLTYWKYKRRANRLLFIIKVLGFEQAVIYGDRRGWVERVENGRIHLVRSGRILR